MNLLRECSKLDRKECVLKIAITSVKNVAINRRVTYFRFSEDDGSSITVCIFSIHI